MSEGRSSITRRSAVATVGAGVVGTLAGCAGVLGGNELQQQLDAVRDATEEYSDHIEALRAGFFVLGPFVPGVGWNFVHSERVESTVSGLSRDVPQALTYDREMNLGAVRWTAPEENVDGMPDLFDDDGAEATETWHAHESETHVFAQGDGQRTNPRDIGRNQFVRTDNWAAFRPPEPDLEPGDTVELRWGSTDAKRESPREERVVDIATTHPDMTTLVAWVHADNPEGVFQPVNPEFAQG